MVTYGLTASSLSSSYISWGTDAAAILFPYLFAFHLTLGILLVGAAPSSVLGNNVEDALDSNDDVSDKDERGNKKSRREKGQGSTTSAINPREGKLLSYLLVFLPPIVHLVTLRQRIVYSYASWDDLFDFVLIATVPYVLHYLLASNGIVDERWRRSLTWILKSGTSPMVACTLRGATVPMTISLLSVRSCNAKVSFAICKHFLPLNRELVSRCSLFFSRLLHKLLLSRAADFFSTTVSRTTLLTRILHNQWTRRDSIPHAGIHISDAREYFRIYHNVVLWKEEFQRGAFIGRVS